VRALSPPFVMVKRFKAPIRTAYGGKYRNNFMAPAKEEPSRRVFFAR
jgi:hypothetical protein